MPYFDNAATTFPKPESVYNFTDKFYREYGVSVGRGQHKLAFMASKMISETRDILLDLFHCPMKKVVFTHTATEALNIILQGLELKEYDNIYLSPFEHNAVTRVIHQLKNIYKVNIHTLAVTKDTFEYDLEKIKYQFANAKPRIVVISHASNVCGVIAPIKSICQLSKKYDAVNLIDMAQTAGLIDTDLSSNIFDFAVFAGHKTLYAPFGVSGFICSGDKLLKPLIYGGTGLDSVNQDLPTTVPERYEVASQNVMAMAGLNAALKWIFEVNIENIIKKERENHKRLLDVLQQFENIKIIGSKIINNNIGVVSCLFDEYSSDSIGQVLSDYDVAVRAGLHCAPFAHKFLNTYPTGTVRFSVSYFNNNNDFDKLNDVLKYIADNS